MEYGVATFQDQNGVSGYVVLKETQQGIRITASFDKLPPGEHGFHIHKNGDLRGEGCLGACEHFHKGPKKDHGGSTGENRHTGDLGNISSAPFKKVFNLKGVSLQEIYGRSFIVHADRDDLGRGSEEDSKTTGHSGKRIACAIIGRATQNCQKTRKQEKYIKPVPQ